MISPFVQMPSGPNQLQEIMRRLDGIEMELKALDPKPSTTVQAQKTAIGTTYEIITAPQISSGVKSVWRP